MNDQRKRRLGSAADSSVEQPGDASEPAREKNWKEATVSVERIVDCPFSLAVGEADVIFPILESQCNGGGIRIPYRTLGLRFSGAVTHRVAIAFRRRDDLTEWGRFHDEIAFDWNAHSRWLPNFQGVLRFRIATLKTRVILNGTYRPPFGPIGMLFDRLIGHRLVLGTCRDILNRLAEALEKRWAEEKKLKL